MAGAVIRRFGTPRGLVRLALAYPQVALGQAAICAPDPASIRRLVFVCHGNICRSAFAEWIARREELRAASFGLSTSTGQAAHPPVAEAARARGLDPDAHRTTAVADFAGQPGDLLLGMEVRHLHRLAANAELGAFPRDLLGRHAAPPVPHLHDPYELDPAYLPTCLDRIERAVLSLAKAFPGARSSG